MTWNNWNEICEFVPQPWFVRGCWIQFVNGKPEEIFEPVTATNTIGLVLRTLESNEFLAKEGDYIIKGIKGEFYACDEKIFNLTYEVVDESNDSTSSPSAA